MNWPNLGMGKANIHGKKVMTTEKESGSWKLMVRKVVDEFKPTTKELQIDGNAWRLAAEFHTHRAWRK